MNEQEFRAHEELRQELELILAKPAMIQALSALEDKAKVRHAPQARLHAHLDTLTAQQYFRLMGIQSAVDDLRRMVQPLPHGGAEQGLDDEPFFHGLSEEMKAAIRQQKQNALQSPNPQ